MSILKLRIFAFCALIATALSVAGCGSPTAPEEPAVPGGEASGSAYLMNAEPQDSMPVGAVRESAQDGQQVSLVGLIGGSTEPFVEGVAAFTIVDPKVPYCHDEEGCPTPWDYCCTQDQVRVNIATVKVVDPAGSVVATDARQLLGVEELSEVVVSGQVQRDEAGNLTVTANKIFVRKS